MSQPRPVLRLSCAEWSVDLTAGGSWYVGIGPGCEVPLPLSGPAEPWFVVRHAGVWSARSIDDRTRLTLDHREQTTDRSVRIGDRPEQELQVRRGGLHITLQILNPAALPRSAASLVDTHLAEPNPVVARGETPERATVASDPASGTSVRPPFDPLLRSSEPGIPRAGHDRSCPPARHVVADVARDGTQAVGDTSPAADRTLPLPGTSPGNVFPMDATGTTASGTTLSGTTASSEHTADGDPPDRVAAHQDTPHRTRGAGSRTVPMPPVDPLAPEISQVVDIASFLALMSRHRWPGRLTVLATLPGARPVRDHGFLLSRTVKVGGSSHDLLPALPPRSPCPDASTPATVFDLLHNSSGRFPPGVITDRGLLLTGSGTLMSWERTLARSRELIVSPPPPISGRLEARLRPAELPDAELLPLLVETARRLLSGTP